MIQKNINQKDIIELEDTFYDYFEPLRKRFDNNGEDFLDYLRDKTGYFDMPASIKYHCNYTHGLLEHSLGVAKVLLDLSYFVADRSYETEVCNMVSLFHDLGKAGMDNQYPYICMLECGFEGKWVHNPEMVTIDVPTKSLIMLSKFTNLTQEEIQAVRYHDGQYVEGNRGVAMKECDLTLLLHWADRWSAQHERVEVYDS